VGRFEAIRKAMNHEPSIDWLLENQESVMHGYPVWVESGESRANN
jgi:hypothetical protein